MSAGMLYACKSAHTLFTSQREGERKKEGGRDREKERVRKREGETKTKREGERGRERESERDVEYVQNFYIYL
jgi:hypothetical protein